MQAWVNQAIRSGWNEWSHEETLKAKALFLDYLGQAFQRRDDEEGMRLAEHLEGFGGEEQATLFAGSRMVPAPMAVLGNGMLTGAPLVFPVVLAAIELQNSGGKELLPALIAGLEAASRFGQHPAAELIGALVGVANVFELDEEGWQVLLGMILPRHTHTQVPQRAMERGLLAHDLVLSAALARDEWNEVSVVRLPLPEEWSEVLERTSDVPGLNSFLMATEVNADAIVEQFRERATGKIPAPHLEYYIDAVMALEDICCIPLFFRRA
jgi:hypothetical protein